MTTNNKKTIRIIDGSYDYGPRKYGKHAGKPTVSLKLSSSDTNSMTVGALDNLLSNYGWKRKLESGFVRCKLYGSEPLADIHTEGIKAFNSIVDPTFLDVELDEKSINRKPSRLLKNEADSFTIFVPLDRSFDEDAFQYFADRSRKFGDIDFVFRISEGGDREKVNAISRDYKLYDSDIWLMPKGRKVHTVKERYDKCEKWAKRHAWNVSPRLDVWDMIEDE